MNVVAACDAKFIQHAGVTLSSLMSARGGDELRIFLLTTASDAELTGIRTLCRDRRCDLEVVRLDAAFFVDFPVRWHLSAATYFRLMIGRALPDHVSRVIYLDSDLIVRRSLRELWDIDLQGRTVGAMREDDGMSMAKLGLPAGSPYFNAGVMVVDLDRWRRLGIDERCFSIVSNEPQRITFADQCALNIALFGDWAPIEAKWNVLTTRLGTLKSKRFVFSPDARRIIDAGCIIHFSNYPKPWHVDCEHPGRELYWREIENTPWKGAAPMGGIRQRIKAVIRKGERLWKAGVTD